MNSFHYKDDYPLAYSPAEGSRGKWLWIIPVFVLLGLLAMMGILALAQHHGEAFAFWAPLIIPLGVALFVLGIGRSFAIGRRLVAQLSWWHFLWLLVFASALVFRIRGVNQIHSDPLDVWALYRVALDFIVAAILVVRLGMRRPPWLGSMFRGYLGLLTLFGFICLVSTVWSIYRGWTLFKSGEYLLGLALLAAILETVRSVGGYETLFNWTWALYALLLLSVVLDTMVWPQAALHGTWMPQHALLGGVRLRGVLPAVSADNVGVDAAMLALVCLCRLLPLSRAKRDRIWYTLAFAASLATLVLSQTRGAFAGFLFGVFLILWFSKRLRFTAAFGFIIGAILLLTSAGGLVWAFLERGQNQHSLSTLSARVTWWTFAWDKFLQRPLLGFGAYAGGRFEVMAQLGHSSTSTVHSDYLSVIVGTGIWGMIPLLAAIAGIWWFLATYLRRSPRTGPEEQLAYEAIAVLGLLTVYSVLLPIFTWQAPLRFLVILGYAEFLRRRLAAARVPSRPRRHQILSPESIPHNATP